MQISLEPLVNAIVKKINSPEVMPILAKALAKEMKKINGQESEKKYYTGKEVDALFLWSAPTRHKYKNEGYLVTVKVGGKTLYTADSVNKMVKIMEVRKKR